MPCGRSVTLTKPCLTPDVSRAAQQWTVRHAFVPVSDTGRVPCGQSRVLCRYRGPPMSSDYVFTMYRADKFYGADRQVLANISLSFLPGAKIGVLGAERRRQVDAAPDHGRQGGDLVGRRRARARRDRRAARAGARARPEPRTCARTSRTACASCATCSTASTRSPRSFAEPDADFDALLAEQATVQDQIDRRDAWQLEAHLDHAMDALRLPDGDRDVTTLSRRRAAARRALPAAAPGARPAAARRADEPPRRRVGVLARALPRRLQGHRRRRHARPVLPRQRRRLDPRARPRARHPVPGQLLGLARAEAGAARARGEDRVGPAAHARSASSSGCGWRRARGTRSRRRVSARTRSCSPRSRT